MKKASFSIEHYYFNKVLIELDNYNESGDIYLDFKPSGVFNKENSNYVLTIIFKARSSEEEDSVPFVEIFCNGTFRFEEVKDIEDIPSYFYRNSIAILFPYLRAYISMVTNQANIPPLVLPTLNLMSLEEPLRENTTIS